MLILTHIGYSVGVARVLEKRVLRRRLDYRLVALMAILPDIVDRFLYVFVIPGARSGRLIAHTLLFNLALLAGLRLFSRRLGPYGLASLGHIFLDLDGLSLRHLLWPILGSSLDKIGIRRDTTAAKQSYGRRLARRIRNVPRPYLHSSTQDLLLEAAGLVTLSALGLRAWRRERADARPPGRSRED